MLRGDLDGGRGQVPSDLAKAASGVEDPLPAVP